MIRQGGGVSPSQKTVKLGDNYGDLPTPTRDGYTFVRWAETGKNLCYFAPTGQGYHDSSSRTTSLIEQVYTRSEFITNTGCSSFYFSFDYEIISTTATKLYFRFYVRSIAAFGWTLNSEAVYPDLKSGRVSTSCNISAMRNQIKFAYCTSDSACSISMKVFNIQIETGDAATDYEPYKIASYMQYTRQGDQTLKAFWKENTSS